MAVSKKMLVEIERRTYRLVQNSRHTIDEKLKVLRSVQSPKVVPIVILGWIPTTILRDGIHKKNKEQLQAVDHKYLLRVPPHHMVIRHSPGCRVVLDGLELLVSRPLLF